jgi:hypothetical protein
MADIKLTLVDPHGPVCDAWELAFAQFPDVSVVRGRFETLREFDCMVSAANSFGLMDGGVDLAITRFFGAQLMERVGTSFMSLSGILCVGHNMRSVHAPQTEIVAVCRALGADSRRDS